MSDRITIPGRALAARLKGAADQVQAFLASQVGGEMPVARLEAMVRAGGVGLSGVQRSIQETGGYCCFSRHTSL